MFFPKILRIVRCLYITVDKGRRCRRRWRFGWRRNVFHLLDGRTRRWWWRRWRFIVLTRLSRCNHHRYCRKHCYKKLLLHKLVFCLDARDLLFHKTCNQNFDAADEREENNLNGSHFMEPE